MALLKTEKRMYTATIVCIKLFFIYSSKCCWMQRKSVRLSWPRVFSLLLKIKLLEANYIPKKMVSTGTEQNSKFMNCCYKDRIISKYMISQKLWFDQKGADARPILTSCIQKNTKEPNLPIYVQLTDIARKRPHLTPLWKLRTSKTCFFH